MDNINNIQGLLSGIQQQLSSIGALASMNPQLAPALAPHIPQASPQVAAPDIAAIVRSTLHEELAKLSQQPPAAPALPPPVPTPQVTSVDLQRVAPTESQVAVKAPERPQPESLQDAMLKDFLVKLRVAIGSGLTVSQQEWLSQNLFELPGFFKSEAGKAALTKVLADYRAYLGQ